MLSGVVTTKTQSFLRSLTARGDLRAGATKHLKWNVIKKRNCPKRPLLFDSQPKDWSLLCQERPDHLAGASTQAFCWASFSIGFDLVLFDCLSVDLVLILADCQRVAWFGGGLMTLRRLALNLAWLDSALRMQQLKTWPWLLFYWKSVFCPQLDIWSSQSRCGLHLGGILFPVPQPLIIAVQIMLKPNVLF